MYVLLKKKRMKDGDWPSLRWDRLVGSTKAVQIFRYITCCATGSRMLSIVFVWNTGILPVSLVFLNISSSKLITNPRPILWQICQAQVVSGSQA